MNTTSIDVKDTNKISKFMIWKNSINGDCAFNSITTLKSSVATTEEI